MNLLSNAGSLAMNNFYNGSSYNTETKQYQSNLSVLNGISTKNSYTNEYTGFNCNSIFNNSSGIQGSGSSCAYNPTFGLSGNDGLNRNKPYSTISTTIPTSVSQYADGQYGSSLMGNFLTSLQSVALGQYAPTSVFEQRLNYTLPFDQQNKPGSMLGDYSNYFNTDSVAKNKNSTTGYNVFGSYDLKTATSAQTVSRLMSLMA